ncbi:hypothetical protein GQR58_014615 [Nymphon striatum]|nr:hypothetical protein GQR58_014615 [Nymphon striatum]
MNTAGTMDCKLVQSLKDYPFHQAYLPQEVCINDQCQDCIKNWVGYFIGQDNIIRKYDSTKTYGRKTPTNGTTDRMSANGSGQATTYHCLDLDLQPCSCNDIPCTGTEEYCNLMECSTSSCKCEIVLEDMHVMVMETESRTQFEDPWFVSFQECLFRMGRAKSDRRYHPARSPQRRLLQMADQVPQPDGEPGRRRTNGQDKKTRQARKRKVTGLMIKYIRSILKFIIDIVYAGMAMMRTFIQLSKRIARLTMSLGVIIGIRLKEKGGQWGKSVEQNSTIKRKVLVMDRGCATVAEAARLVDCYALNRQAVAAKATLQDGTTTGSTSRFINTRTADGQIICYHCQLPGHAARFCPSRAVKAKTQYTPQITAISDLNLFDNEPEQGNCQITVSLDLAPELREEGVSCKPGLKLCRSCSKFWSKREENVETEMEVEGAEDPEFEGETISKKEKLDTFLTAIGISPLKLHGIAQHQRLATAKSKLGRAYTQIGDGNGNVDIEVKNQIVLGCTSTLLRKKALQKSMELSDLMKLGKAIELSETQVGVMENYSSSSNPALKVSTGKHCFKCGGDYPHKGELSQPKRENVTIIPGDGDIKNFLQPFTVV